VIEVEALHAIAPWSHGLTDAERARAARGISEKAFPKGGYVCHLGDRLDAWVGVVDGLLKLSTVTLNGKAMTFAGIAAGGWFGEGSLLKNEARRYDVVALRDSRLALMDRATFHWLYENSTGFSRYLVCHFNERLSQFMAQVEFDRTLNATERLARTIAWLFNPVFYPRAGSHLKISQEELGLLCGTTRQSANQALRLLEDAGVIRLEAGGITVSDIGRLSRFST
jgi:CRP-like cAMP-binding protein